MEIKVFVALIVGLVLGGCGGSSAEVIFQEVISQSATADEPLGTLAGRGMDSNHKGGHIIVRATEQDI